MVQELFLEVALVVALAALVGIVATGLRQPLLVGFLVAGLLAGPQVLGLVTEREPFEVLAELGIVLLLFAVGLKLHPSAVRRLGLLALIAGTVQVVVTSALGFVLARALGFDVLPSVYIGVAFSFSSTLVIVKLVSDMRDEETLHGRLAVALLIVQDVWVVLVLVALSLFEVGQVEAGAGGLIVELLWVLAAGVALLGVAYGAMRVVFPRVLGWLARSKDVLLVFSLAWAVVVAAGASWAGLSTQLGGFVAGLAMAGSEYSDAVGSRMVSLRDFMLLFFFVVLGAQLDFGLLGGLLLPAVVFALFVFFLKPLLVIVVLSFAGFRGRTTFLTASMMGQTSEFGLVLGAMGLSLGHLGGGAMGLITVVTFLTMAGSTYVVLNNRRSYERLRPWMDRWERLGKKPDLEEDEEAEPPDVVVFGLGRFGGGLARRLEQRGYRVWSRDFDPRMVERGRQQGLDAAYGDAEDPEYLSQMPWEGVRLVVSAIPQVTANRVLTKGLEHAGYKGRLVATAHREEDEMRLREYGLEVLLPFEKAGELAADRLVQVLEGQGQGPPDPGGSPGPQK